VSWSLTSPVDLGLLLAGAGIGVTVLLFVGSWLWRRRRENSKSLSVNWDRFYQSRNVGQEFYFQTHIRNLTQQVRVVSWDDIVVSVGYRPYDVGFVELWEPDGSHRVITPPIRIGPGDSTTLFFVLRAARLGDCGVRFTIRETSDKRTQEYRSEVYTVSVEERRVSDWKLMPPEKKEEFVVQILTVALQKSKTRELTRSRVIRFYDLVEQGRLTISPGATWQSFEGYSRAERIYLLSAAIARGIEIEWGPHSMPTHGLWRLLYK
jgi:hypothetical protein